jgi:hypothetical protein
VGKETKEHPNTKAQKDKDNTKDKRKAKAGDGAATNDRNRGYQGLKPNHDYPARNTYTQILNQVKGKGKWKESWKGKPYDQKGKGKGRGKGKHGVLFERKDDPPKITNNSQQVYLDPPKDEGDDETTIIFTSNMNRSVEPEKTNDDDNNGSDYLTTIITGIITTMRQVPNNHFVWNYSDPTRTYYVLGLDEDKNGANPLELLLRPHNNKILNQFIDWYEGQLMVTHEIRETISQVPDLPVQSLETATSSTQMESSSSELITWGARQVRNLAEELKQWEDTPKRELYNTKDQKDATTDAKQPSKSIDSSAACNLRRP